MRPWTLYLKALAFAALVGLPSLHAQVAAPPASMKNSDPDQVGEKDRPDLRRDSDRWWFGGDPTPEYLDAKKELAKQEMERWAYTFPGFKGALPAIPSASSAWTNLGPKKSTFSVYSGQAPTFPDVDSGRLSVLGLLTHPTNPQILYVGTSGGGVFKCTNANLASSSDWTWTPITDNLPTATSTGNVSVGAIAMSPVDPETLFLGLGDQVDATGRGLYKTSNGGTSWTELGSLGTTTRVMSLLVLDANTILVGGNAGIWYSTNGGTSFTNLSLGGSTGGSIWSIQRVGTSTTNLSATMQNSSGNGSFWYSTNGGASWTQSILDSGATGQNPGRATVRGTPGSATTVWAISENRTTGVFARGVFKSTDGGVNWTFLPAPTVSGGLFQPLNQPAGSDGGQAFYNHCLAVDPADPNKLFVAANLTLFRSTDGGASWTQMTSWNSTNLPYAHADFHTSAWSQSGSTTLFLGNDGGLCVVRDPYRATPPFTTDPNAYATVDVTFVDNTRNRGMTSHLVYFLGSTLASSPAGSRYQITLGLQDLSSRIRVDEGSGLQTSGTWNDPTGTGDGFGTVISPTDGNKMMVSSYYARPKRSVDAGTTWASASSGISGAGSGSSAPFKTLLRLGLADPTGNTVYTCTNLAIYKTTDWAASSWNPVSMTGFTGTLIRNFNASPSDPNALAIAANSGNVWVTYNGGTSWTNPAGGDITSGALNLGYVAFDSNNNQVLYATSVVLSTTNHHLWKSTNGGATWNAIDGPGNGFPFGIVVHVIQNDPTNSSRLLAGTDFGVYESNDGGTSWVRYGTGLPMVATRDIYVAPDSSFVRAGTYGRGVWEITGGAPPVGPTITTQPASQVVTVGQTATFTVAATGTGTLSYQWKRNSVNVGTNSPSYTTPATVIGDNGAQFQVAVTDTTGTTNSAIATLTVNPVVVGPVITSQPANQTVTLPQQATFSVSATGTGTLTYQWKKNGTDIAGATASSFTTPLTSLSDNGTLFRVAVTDTTGTTLSNNATLTVNACPGGGTNQVLQNPGFEAGSAAAPWVVSHSAIIDNNSANAHSGSWLAYMGGWSSPTTDFLYQPVTIPSGATAVNLSFWLAILNDSGTTGIAQNVLTLKVQDASGADLATLDTWSNLNAGSSYVQRGPYNLMAYQGQTIRIYLTSVQPNPGPNDTAFFLDDFTLNVTTGSSSTAPSITTQPANQSVSPGGTATFSVVASGSPTLFYQWRKNGTAIPGATNATFSIASAQTGDAGSYDVQVANCAGTITSTAATLTVAAAVSVSINPSTAQTLLLNGTMNFTATVTGTSNTAVTWSVTGGSGLSNITSTSVTYTAPASATTVTLTATSVADATKSASVTINVRTRDLSGDGTIDVLDLGMIMKAWTGPGVLGAPNYNPLADLNGDGDVDDDDITLFLAGF